MPPLNGERSVRDSGSSCKEFGAGAKDVIQQSLNGLLRGDFPVVLSTEESSRALIDAKELKLIAVFSDKNEYPGVPDIKNLGYP